MREKKKRKRKINDENMTYIEDRRWQQGMQGKDREIEQLK